MPRIRLAVWPDGAFPGGKAPRTPINVKVKPNPDQSRQAGFGPDRETWVTGAQHFPTSD